MEGSLSAAESNFKRAVVLLTRFAGADGIETAKALAALGRLYAEWGRYEEGSQLLRNARVIAEKGMPRTSPLAIHILDSQASLFSGVGRFAEAEKCWLRALKIAENIYGDKGLEYSAVLLHLGQLYTEIRDYPSAEAMLQRGVAAEQMMASGEQMDLAIMMSALANAYLQQRKFSRAEPLFLHSEQVLNSHCKPTPLACSAVETYLGNFHMAKSQWQAAAGEYERALTLRQSALGEHPLVASSLLSLSRALRKLKRKKEANVYQAQAQKILSLPGTAAFNSKNTIDIRSFRASN